MVRNRFSPEDWPLSFAGLSGRIHGKLSPMLPMVLPVVMVTARNSTSFFIISMECSTHPAMSGMTEHPAAPG
jgi:hypothetical protein